MPHVYAKPIAVLDGTTYAAYCQSYSEWKQADSAIQAAGSLTMPGKVTTIVKGDSTITNESGDVPRPEVKIRDNARAAMRVFLVEFGMSPSSRTRISVKPPVEDDLDKLLAT